MTVEQTSTYVRLAGNGVTTSFTFPFRIFDVTDLVVSDIDESLPYEAPSVLNYPADYSVAISSTGEGGFVVVTAAIASGHSIDIRSSVELTQPTDIRNQGAFFPDIHEGVFDRLLRQVQTLDRKVGASLRYPDDGVTNADAAAPAVSSRAGRYLYSNPTTGEFEWVTSISTTALSQSLFDGYLGTSSASILGGVLYPLTSTEQAVSVVPATFQYPYLANRRYASIADLITAAGSTSTMHGGRSQFMSGVSSISATVTIDRKTGVYIGDNPGSQTAGDGTCIVWTGTAGIPMLEFKRCWATTVQCLRLKGKSSAKPSAAIKLTSTLAESPVNTAMAFEHIWIGTYGVFDSDNAIQFVDGFVVDGANLQGDQSHIKHITVQGVTTSCIAFRQTQNTLWSIETATLNSATYGIENKSRHITAKNVFCQTISAADYYLPTDSSMTVEGFGSELGGRLAYALDGFDFTFRRGYFQAATANVTASGRIIDLTSSGNGSITMEDVQIYAAGGYAGPTLKFYVRGAKVLIKLKNVSLPSAIDTFFDFTTLNSGDSRHVILENVYDSTGAVFNGDFYWIHGDYAPTYSLDALGKQHRPVLTASATVDPVNLTAGSSTGATIGVTDARLGDYVQASFTQDLLGIILTAWVSSNDNVKYTFYNPTAGAIDLSSGTLRLRVMKY